MVFQAGEDKGIVALGLLLVDHSHLFVDVLALSLQVVLRGDFILHLRLNTQIHLKIVLRHLVWSPRCRCPRPPCSL